MSIVVQCECGKKYKVGEQNAGKKMRCKACNGVIAIPQPQGEPAEEWDEFDDAGFDAFGGIPESRPRRNSGARSKGKRKKGKQSAMSPAVKYGICGGIIVVTTGIVIGILMMRGVIGKSDSKSETVAQDGDNDDSAIKSGRRREPQPGRQPRTPIRPTKDLIVGTWDLILKHDLTRIRELTKAALMTQLGREPTQEEIRHAVDAYTAARQGMWITLNADGTCSVGGARGAVSIGVWETVRQDAEFLSFKFTEARRSIMLTGKFADRETFLVTSAVEKNVSEIPGRLTLRKATGDSRNPKPMREQLVGTWAKSRIVVDERRLLEDSRMAVKIGLGGKEPTQNEVNQVADRVRTTSQNTSLMITLRVDGSGKLTTKRPVPPDYKQVEESTESCTWKVVYRKANVVTFVTRIKKKDGQANTIVWTARFDDDSTLVVTRMQLHTGNAFPGTVTFTKQ